VSKGPLALRTISETADLLGVPQHVLRFWETKFTFIRPTKRAGGRRFYRPQDIEILNGVKTLLYDRGYTIRGVQKLFKDQGQKAILGAHAAAVLPTEQGLVGEDEIAAENAAGVVQPVFDSEHGGLMITEEVRARFLDIARQLDEAQATLGRTLGRDTNRGKFSRG
jgi:DNA-binding transcriptional MerR regulator